MMLPDPKPRGRLAHLAWVRRHAVKRRRFTQPTRRQLSRAFTTSALMAFADTLHAWATSQITAREMNLANSRQMLAHDVAKHGTRAALSQAIRIMRAVSADPRGGMTLAALESLNGARMRRILGFDGAAST